MLSWTGFFTATERGVRWSDDYARASGARGVQTTCTSIFRDKLDYIGSRSTETRTSLWGSSCSPGGYYFLGSTAGILAILRGSPIPRRRHRRLLEAHRASVGTR